MTNSTNTSTEIYGKKPNDLIETDVTRDIARSVFHESQIRVAIMGIYPTL